VLIHKHEIDLIVRLALANSISAEEFSGLMGTLNSQDRLQVLERLETGVAGNVDLERT
jgi:hypothetical protein